MTSSYLTMSTDQLTDLYRNRFLAVHGYNITFVPNPLTREWLIDQLFALEWYRAYEHSVASKPEVKKRVVKKDTNPFK